MIAEALVPLATPLDKLTLLPGNPRRGDVAAVARSLETFGQRKAIVANRDGTIIAGNHTFQAAQSLGWPEIAVVFVDDDDATAKAYALADNRTAELGGYDDVDLEAFMSDVAACDADLLAATGWSEDDLAILRTGIAKMQAMLIDPDDAPASAPALTVPGDLWLLGPHRLLCGDSTVSDDVTRVMNGERAVLMATDPPYLVDYDASNHPQSWNGPAPSKNKSWDEYKDPINEKLYIEFLRLALELALDKRAPIYQWHAGMRADLVFEAWNANNVLPHQQIIWVKSRAVLTRAHLMNQHEPCYMGWARGMQPIKTRRAPTNATTVWQINQQGQTDRIHPTQKPVELIRRPIEWHTRLGELLYEPFGGSGTAIIAAEMMGRRCFTIEKATEFCDVICKRYQLTTGILPIAAATGVAHNFCEPA